MVLTIHVAGAEPVHLNMLRFAARSNDFRPALSSIATRLEGEVEKQFATHGDSGGTPWAPLSEFTLARKQALGYPDESLVATGDMKRSFREGSSDHIREITNFSLIFGSRDPKAQYHQHGTKHMPARPMLVLTPMFRREIVKRLQRFVIGEPARATELVRS